MNGNKNFYEGISIKFLLNLKTKLNGIVYNLYRGLNWQVDWTMWFLITVLLLSIEQHTANRTDV